MTMLRWTVPVLLACASPLIAEMHPRSSLSAFEIRLELFGAKDLQRSDDSTRLALSPSGESPKRKSVGIAAIYSLLVPGMGELYTGGFSSGKYFLIAEGVLWLGYAVLDIYGNAIRDDARMFAVVRAGVNPAGKNDQFYVDIGNFLDVDEYNQKKLRDREPEKLYDPSQGYGWKWDADASRVAFRDRRVASDNAYNSRKFVVAAVLVNHIASAINAARSAIAHNRSLEEPLGDLQIGAHLLGGVQNPHGVMLTVTKTF
jgi:hypothetical protein